MGLISGIFMGIIFGIGLMVGWKHMMQYQSTKRVAKVKWLNKQLGKLWPSVAERRRPADAEVPTSEISAIITPH